MPRRVVRHSGAEKIKKAEKTLEDKAGTNLPIIRFQRLFSA
jgi:hypothetical protein